jgi:glutamate dehydrogenase
LFFTNDARRALERAGAVLFKDASTNKGGVCSSSMEVLTGLALTDEQHAANMRVGDISSPPAFYARMKVGMIKRIEENARREFEALWRERSAGATNTETTDALSLQIFRLKGLLMSRSETLLGDPTLFRYLIKSYVPAPILELVTIDDVLRRVPKNYLLAIAATTVASQFAYRVGPYRTTGVELLFHEYMSELRELARKSEGTGKPSKL